MGLDYSAWHYIHLSVHIQQLLLSGVPLQRKELNAKCTALQCRPLNQRQIEPKPVEALDQNGQFYAKIQHWKAFSARPDLSLRLAD